MSKRDDSHKVKPAPSPAERCDVRVKIDGEWPSCTLPAGHPLPHSVPGPAPSPASLRNIAALRATLAAQNYAFEQADAHGVPDFEGDTHVATQSEPSFMEPVVSADRVWCLGLRCGHEINIISSVHRPNIKGNEWRCDRCADISALRAALEREAIRANGAELLVDAAEAKLKKAEEVIKTLTIADDRHFDEMSKRGHRAAAALKVKP
jgi:hypothetical protein